jgi:ferric-dicitrate binding protein FerR (iron transport regulator)
VLTGEAFFDVTRNLKKPFKVITDEIMVTVLGTKFNIASYHNEKAIEIALEEGSLVFSDRDMKKTCLMKPNDFLLYNKTNKDFKIKNDGTEKYSSWKDGKLVFRNDPIDVVKNRLERWYNIDVEIKGEFGDDIRLRATFIDESLEEVMKVLKRVMHINYRIEEQKITSGGVYTKKKIIISKSI